LERGVAMCFARMASLKCIVDCRTSVFTLCF
jgi:hypothetical protein